MTDDIDRSGYLRDRRAAARAAGLCTVCRSSRANGTATRCKLCLMRERDRARARRVREARGQPLRINGTAHGYIPLDEALSKPIVKALRVLRRQGSDWTDSEDLTIACEIPEDHRMLESFRCALRSHVKLGNIERSGNRRGNAFRITVDGARALADMLARSAPSPEEFEGDENQEVAA